MEEMDFFDDDDLLDFEEEADDDNKDKKSPQETVGQDFGAELLLSEGCLNLQLKQNEIHFNSLAALNLEDLEILGLPDFGKRQQVLNEISHIPNQDIHFDKVLRETNIDQHKEDVLQSVNKHLRDLKTSIAVANLKFQVLPPEYILVDETTYCSSLVLKLLNEIEKNAELMEKNLLELIEGRFEEKPKKTKLKILINSICVIGAVSASTFLIYSACKSRFSK